MITFAPLGAALLGPLQRRGLCAPVEGGGSRPTEPPDGPLCPPALLCTGPRLKEEKSDHSVPVTLAARSSEAARARPLPAAVRRAEEVRRPRELSALPRPREAGEREREGAGAVCRSVWLLHVAGPRSLYPAAHSLSSADPLPISVHPVTLA